MMSYCEGSYSFVLLLVCLCANDASISNCCTDSEAAAAMQVATWTRSCASRNGTVPALSKTDPSPTLHYATEYRRGIVGYAV